MLNNNFFRLIKSAALAFFILSFGLAMGQRQKFDMTFRAIYENRDALKAGKTAVLETVPQGEVLRQADNDGRVLYSAIIYTKNPKAIQAKGIAVQAVFPNFVTALISVEDLETLAGMPEVTRVKAPDVLKPNNDIAAAGAGATLLQNGAYNNISYKGKNVLVGVLDSGIDWKHPDFRDAADQSKSRILRIWDQTITKTGSENSPAGFTYGVEYTQAQISADLAGNTGAIREKDIDGHGTHVAGTVAGNGAALGSHIYAGMAPEADYIIVKAGNGSFSSTNVINGLKYFANVAGNLNRPIVVNMSLGGHGSAHDGTGSQEDAINDFSSAPGRVVVIAAGNDNGSNIHKQTQLAAGASAPIVFNVNSTNTTSKTLFAFMLYSDDSGPLTATLTDPQGNTSPVLAADSDTGNAGVSMPSGFTYLADNNVDDDNGDRYVWFYIKRTSGTAQSPIGNWTITLKNTGSKAVKTDGWLYGIDPDISKVSLVDGDSNMLVGSPGDAKSAITVAASAGKTTFYSNNSTKPDAYGVSAQKMDDIAGFSSHGPLRDGSQKPDITADGQFLVSALASGSIDAASTSNVDGKYYQIMAGTSMATPVVAGISALLLQANPAATVSAIKDALTKNAQTDEITGAVPNTTWGYGRADVFQALTGMSGGMRKRKTYLNEKIPFSLTDNRNIGEEVQNRIAQLYTSDLKGYIGGVYYYIGSLFPSASTLTVEIRKEENGVPGALLYSKSIDSKAVSKFSWNYVSLVDASKLNNKGAVAPGTRFFVTLYTVGNERWSYVFQKENPNASTLLSTDGGQTWNTNAYVARMRAVVYEDPNAVMAVSNAGATASLSIYPNPATDVLNVHLPKNEKSTLRVYDVSGRLVKEMKADSDNIEMTVGMLPKGAYLLSIETASGKTTKKFIKE